MRKISGRFGAAAGITALTGMMLAAAIAAPGQTFTTLYSFCAQLGCTDGTAPSWGWLVQGIDGNFYGATYNGGTSTSCMYGCGSVFRLSPTGTFTTVHNFDSTDGSFPFSGLLLGSDGNFYGTTTAGGANNYGTVFKLTPQGTLTTLHSFDSTDGAYPYGELIQAGDGSFYGTTNEGGTGSSCPFYGCGTVFRITPTGVLTVLHRFDLNDGEFPYGNLVQASDGDLFGTTNQGGSRGYGTVFRMSLEGALETLQNFITSNGSYPYAGLIQASDGNLYGTTQGAGGGEGTVFRMTLGGTLTTIQSFGYVEGAYPYDGLIQATDGNLYGTAEGYGIYGDGTVFKLTLEGTLTTLHSFRGTDGELPFAGLLQATNGTFYGITEYGGKSSSCTVGLGCGTLFGLSVGLGPFVKTVPTSGKVGQSLMILGTDLNGVDSVTFNGTAASFKVISGSLISTTVPTGASTGPVQVVTPSGTLTSNVNFRVEP